MRSKLIVAILMASSAPAWAQTAISKSQSSSNSAALAASRATAIGGGNAQAQGGNATGGSAAVNIAGSPASTTSTVRQEVTGTQTLRTAPQVVAPGLTAAGIETCLGSGSGGVSVIGTGVSLGTTYPDGDCNKRLYARTLWAMGKQNEALAILCLSPDVRYVMRACAQYLPQAYAAPVGYAQPAGATYYYEDPSQYRGGPIMLVSGKTGQEYLCNDYDLSHQRCRDGRGVRSPKPHQEVRVAHKRPAPVAPVEAAKPKEDYTP
jgi:hypothetical protein